MTEEIISPAAPTPTERDQDNRPDSPPAPESSAPLSDQVLDGQSAPFSANAPVPDQSTPASSAEDQGSDGQSSFADQLKAFERSHTHRAESKQGESKQLE